MPLTNNDWIGDGSGYVDLDDAWSLGVMPGATNNAVISAPGSVGGDDPIYIGAGAGPPYTFGELTFTDGDTNDYDWSGGSGGPINVLGDVALNNVDSLVIGYVGGNITGDGGLASLIIASLDGSVTWSNVMATGIFATLTCNDGTGVITFDTLSGTTPNGNFDNFNGTLDNLTGSPIDLNGSSLGDNATLSPNRAAFTNFTGGAAVASGGSGSSRLSVGLGIGV